MSAVNVVLGQITAEEDGPSAPQGDGEHSTEELRRTITVTVSKNLAGKKDLKKFQVVTPGWIIRDGKKIPFTYEGWPWLQVGDRVLLAVDDPAEPGEYGFMSAAGIQIFRDSKIEATPGNTSPLSKTLVGLTEAAVVRAFAGVELTD